MDVCTNPYCVSESVKSVVIGWGKFPWQQMERLPEGGESRTLFGGRKHVMQVVAQQLLVHHTWKTDTIRTMLVQYHVVSDPLVFITRTDLNATVLVSVGFRSSVHCWVLFHVCSGSLFSLMSETDSNNLLHVWQQVHRTTSLQVDRVQTSPNVCSSSALMSA